MHMKSIDVCLSPELMHLYDVHDKTVVVVDILRATSCMTTAFAHGIHSITPFAKLEECYRMKTAGYFIAGERDGKKVDGFDFGNSPFEYMGTEIKNAKIAFTTTNGTQAIALVESAKEVIIGSFLNLAAVTDHLLHGENDVLILCAGWKGKVNLEDTLFAGAIVQQTKGGTKAACDAPLAAQHLYKLAEHNLFEFLRESSHVQRLARLNIYKDIEFCLNLNQYHTLPILQDGILVAG